MDLRALKVRHRYAGDIGDKEEEAKLANQIGEVYFLGQNYDKALRYQRKHFHWAKQVGDIVEQQRSSTQLGYTCMELYENTDRFSALADAKAYFQTSLDLACHLRTNPPADQASPWAFVVEQADAYNNLGFVRFMAEDYKQALKFYSRALKLCDKEEMDTNEGPRSRIHHNLGRLYGDLREFNKAKSHAEKDIGICQQISDAQGEARGLTNLADLHFKCQEYKQSTLCYIRALCIAQKIEDADSLCSEIKANIDIVQEAKVKFKSFNTDMQKLFKSREKVGCSKWTKKECELLMELTNRAEELQAWNVHLEMAKRMKKLTTELGDKEKLADAVETVACSYYNLRNFEKATKWHLKSFELCKRIGHLEGQIASKINYGNALHAWGKVEAALEAYKEALEAANGKNSTKMIEHKIKALDNIQYCFVYLENLNEARKINLQLKQLKFELDTSNALDEDEDERCSETNSEGLSEHSSMAKECVNMPSPIIRKRVYKLRSKRSKIVLSDSEAEDEDNIPLSLLFKLSSKVDKDSPLASSKKKIKSYSPSYSDKGFRTAAEFFATH